MTAGGAGVTLLPTLAVAVENRRDALRVRPFTRKGPARTVALVWRKGSALEATFHAVGDTLRQAYAALVERVARSAQDTRSAGRVVRPAVHFQVHPNASHGDSSREPRQ